MNEKDIKAILWLLEEIDNDKMMGSYFRHQLNLRDTDLAKLIKWFKDMVKINKNPMFEVPLHTIREDK